MAERVTIADIADHAGVSPATVSRVLNDPKRVKAETREQIYAAMRSLNYIPPTAHHDPSTLSNIIGFFAPNLLLDSATELVRAVEAELAGTTFDILLVNMRGERDFGAFIAGNSHILKKIDGAIVFSADITEQAVAFMRGADVPMVLMQARSRLVRSVSNNNFRGGQDAGGPPFVVWLPSRRVRRLGTPRPTRGRPVGGVSIRPWRAAGLPCGMSTWPTGAHAGRRVPSHARLVGQHGSGCDLLCRRCPRLWWVAAYSGSRLGRSRGCGGHGV